MKIFFGGGLNESQAPDIAEAALGSYNFELAPDSYRLTARSPFDLIATATNGGEVRGLMQLVKRDNSETTLVQAADSVYKWDGASTFTSMGSCNATSQLRDTYWSLGDYAVVTDIQKLTVVKKWDGTTFSTLSTGLGSSLYAKYGIVHNGRMWLFNVTTSSDTPHLMVASAFEDPQNYDTTQRAVSGTFSTGLEAFYILSPDLRPINGAMKTVAGDLIISTVEGSLFKLTGTDAQDYAFVNFYPGSQTVGTESMTSTGNDVMYMRKGGAIESLTATQKYGDVESDDLSRWIVQTVADLTAALTVYDQKNQKVLFFVSNKVLVLFKDLLYGGVLSSDTGEKKQLSPWSVYRTLHSSSFNTNAAKYMRMPGTTNTTVYFGGPTGEIFDFNGVGASGDGGNSSVQLIRSTRLLDNKDGVSLRHIVRGNVQYRRTFPVTINVELDWADEYNTSTASILLKGVPLTDLGWYWGGVMYWGGAFYWNQGFTFVNKISHQNFDVVGRGPGFFVTLSSLDVLNYRIDNIELL